MSPKLCFFLGFASLCALTACSSLSGKNGYFNDRMQAYQAAKSTAPLTFPTGTEPQGLENYYPVPPVPAHQSTGPVSTLPPDLLKS